MVVGVLLLFEPFGSISIVEMPGSVGLPVALRFCLAWGDDDG
jgi:hypothetical protein